MPYLDHAATTPLREEALTALNCELAQPGNASSLHATGRRARRVVEEARESLAEDLGARPGEVVFTSGGTESDNIAVKGLYWARRQRDPRRIRVLVSAVEHHAVLEAAEWLGQAQGAEVVVLEVDRHGRVQPDTLAEQLDRGGERTALVSVMWANNEIGTVQPVAELAALCADYGVPFHTDAVQAVPSLAVDFAASGAGALTMTGHKLGAPVGTGALLLRRGLACAPLVHGGGQERDVHSGTLAVAGIAALAAATRAAVAGRDQLAARLAGLREQLVAGVLATVDDVVVNGDPDPAGRLPGVAHLSFPGCEGDSLLMLLDARGVECSTGSACTAGVARASHVVLATGVGEELARGSLRFSFGHPSGQDDVARVLAEIGPVVERARRAGVLTQL